jgi:hypothetical protein
MKIDEEIIEGNIVIAKFMGHLFLDAPKQYHFSWDWLMPVIEKIEDLDFNERVSHTYSIEITGNGTTAYKNLYSDNDHIISRHNIHNNRLRCTWLVVIDFIQWYNEKNSKKKEK